MIPAPEGKQHVEYTRAMSFVPLPFPALPWTPGGHPLEEKKLGDAPGVVLLRFAPGFEDPQICRGDHVLYVLSGELTLGLDDETVTLGPGEGCTLRAGTAHRAANSGEEAVTLLAVSAPLLADV